MLQEKTLDLIRQVQRKVEDLFYYSDSVFPYSVSGVGEDNFSLYPIMNASPEAEFHEIELKDFFSRLVRAHSWMPPEELSRAQRYSYLLEFLLSNFESVKVVKTGSIHIDVHIIARTFQKDYIIISTTELIIPVYQHNDA